MIGSADEFVRLRISDAPDEQDRAAHDRADESVWFEVVERYPEMRFWVAHNKTVPLAVLEHLRHDEDARVRSMVRGKGSWRRAHPDDFTRSGDPE